jgi:GGDEF domain-containing protein
MLQIDIDFFKSFNDQYGYTRGDEAIQTLARIILDSVQKLGGPGDFVGHIGGDDFVVLTEPPRAEAVAEQIIAGFNEAVQRLYDDEDRERGYVEVPNRRHVTERFSLMSLTIAMVSTDRMPVSHLAELIDIAQDLKSHGKGIPGSVLVGERRRRVEGDTGPDSQQVA